MKNYFLLLAASLCLAVSANAQNTAAPLPPGVTPVTLNPADSAELASSLKDGLLIEKDIQLQDLQNADKRKEWQQRFRADVARVTDENHFGPNVAFDYTRFQFLKTEPVSKAATKSNAPVPVNLGQNRPLAKVKNK